MFDLKADGMNRTNVQENLIAVNKSLTDVQSEMLLNLLMQCKALPLRDQLRMEVIIPLLKEYANIEDVLSILHMRNLASCGTRTSEILEFLNVVTYGMMGSGEIGVDKNLPAYMYWLFIYNNIIPDEKAKV